MKNVALPAGFLLFLSACTNGTVVESKRTPKPIERSAVKEETSTQSLINIEVSIQLSPGSNTLTWDSVEGASFYNLYILDNPDASVEEAATLKRVVSPYAYIKPTPKVQYFKISAIIDGKEIVSDSIVNDEPSGYTKACIGATGDLKITFSSILSATGLKDCYQLGDKSSEIDVLNLSTSNISDISPLKSLISLRELNLSGNSISDLEPLADLLSIEVLDLSQNPVENLAPLQKLVKIQTLSVEGINVAREEAICPSVTTSAPLSLYCLDRVRIEYDPHIKKLLEIHCIGCHADYDEERITELAEIANQMISDGTMPKGKDPLSDSDKNIFNQWAN